ncbi:MFS transporter, partial [Actinosynnema sp. NPDC020468]|uniref:MFS transporter n=1 Tax=Actinosynnema sp. NPDC020468 TaxID=3154488 RepID=UPI0033DF95DE
MGRALGRRFGWLWAAYGVSAFGTWLAFDAVALTAILVLGAGPAEVAGLAAVGRAVGAVVAVPSGPWVEFRRKRSVMVGMDLVRFGAVVSVPVAFVVGALTFGQLLVVSVVVAAADIAFRAASGAYLKSLVRPEDLLIANGRFESTTWTATALGPPAGGVAIALFGPVATLLVDAVSYLLSALGLRAIGGREPRPARGGTRLGRADLVEGWRFVLVHPVLRPLLVNTVLVNGLVLATSPLLAVLMLGDLGFAPWQYGLAFGVPCLGGLLGSRLVTRLVTRFGAHRVLWWSGALRACWSLGLAFVGPGAGGLLLVIVVELGLITCMGVFVPVFATSRLDLLPTDRVARALSAWSVTGNAVTAAMTAAWGVLAVLTGPRIAIAVAGVLLLLTPFSLPRNQNRAPPPPRAARGGQAAAGWGARKRSTG